MRMQSLGKIVLKQDLDFRSRRELMIKVVFNSQGGV